MTQAAPAAAPLQTLGELRLGRHTEVKPLLLLTYMLLQGPCTREELARLFWPDVSDARNSLRVALSRLRRWGVQLRQDGAQISASHPCDATAPVIGSGKTNRQNRPFLAGVALFGVSGAFEDWVLEQRERLALKVQDALLIDVAARPADRQRLLERAWRVAGAPLPTGHTLARFLALCCEKAPLYRCLTRELADLSGGWCPARAGKSVQALLAWWLDGGFAWLSGSRERWLQPLTGLCDALQQERLPVYRVNAGVESKEELTGHVTRLLESARHQTVTVVLENLPRLPGYGDVIRTLRAQWPDARFIALGWNSLPEGPATLIDLLFPDQALSTRSVVTSTLFVPPGRRRAAQQNLPGNPPAYEQVLLTVGALDPPVRSTTQSARSVITSRLLSRQSFEKAPRIWTAPRIATLRSTLPEAIGGPARTLRSLHT